MKSHATQITRCYVLLLFLVIIFLSQFAFADTEVGGNITEDTTWTKANSPYIVTSNVQVFDGIRLTIEPGVEIRFNQNTALNVAGELNAVGTENEIVTFTSNGVPPSPGDWEGITFNSQSRNNIISFCIIEYGGADNNKGGVYAEETSCYITDSIVRYNNSNGIRSHLGSYSEFRDNLIENNQYQGIYTRTPCVVSNNVIRYNGGGVYISSEYTVEIRNNNISNNGGALNNRSPYGNVTVSYNKIYENSGGHIMHLYAELEKFIFNDVRNNVCDALIYAESSYLFNGKFNWNNFDNNDVQYLVECDHQTGGTYHGVDMTQNWWGEDENLDEKIYDYYDDITIRPTIVYDPVATQAFKTVDFSASPRSGSYPLEVTFSNNSIGVIKSSEWDFGDGETSTELNPIHTYDSLGTFTVSLSVTNPEGTFTENKVDYITISNGPPTANAGSDQTVDEGVTVTLDGSNSSDPDDGIASYMWTQPTGSLVTLSDPTAAKPTFVTPPVNINETTLTFQLTVEDNGGLQSSDEISVTINDNGITGFPADVVTMTSSTGESIGIKEDSGGNCVSLSAVDPSTITNTTNKPENLIYGLINMVIKTDTVGGTVKLTFYLPTPAPDEYKWFKYGPNKGWYDYSNHAVFNVTRDQVTLTLVDGGAGDDDSVANSVIVDPSGLGAASSSSPSPPQPSSTGGGGGGCFIATAAYGSYMEPHVVILREFRDRFLLTYPAGKAFVDLYYAYSPPIANCIAQNETLQAAVRLILLPLVGISWMSLNFGSLPALILMFVVGFGLIGLAGFRRKLKKR
jgi:PKD repeat protein